jgi:histidinol-phosphate aminotransferase
MSRFLSGRFTGLTAYVPGEQYQNAQYIKLNTNESPYPPSPGVLRLLADEGRALNLYPDPECAVLRERLAQTYGVNAENVLPGNGSDELLSFAFMAFGTGAGAVFPDVSYGFYPVYAKLYGLDYREAPLREDFTVDVNDYLRDARMVVLANPNAPTGIALPLEAIETITASNPDRVVLIDEAYVDFGGESAVPLTKKYENLLVVQTYSKARSMAGARLGYAIGNAGLIGDLNKLKYSTNPYNVNRLTLAAGIRALEDDAYYRENCRRVVETREYAAERLRAMGFELTDSKTNFIFARTPKLPGGELYERLKARGILIRHFAAPRIADFVRITVGSREQMDALLGVISDILK